MNFDDSGLIDITRPGKNPITVTSPVMPAAGTFGFGDLYADLVNIEKLGAVVTNPVTYQPWHPASGTRVVPLAGGILVHTGLPNDGVSKVVEKYSGKWLRLPVPVIVHVVFREADDLRRCLAVLDREESVDGIELGLNDGISLDEVDDYVSMAAERSEKPVLVRLPMQNVEAVAEVAAEAGADSLVVCAPPRGTTRDHSGRLVSGRLYGPMIKPLVLRYVGLLVRQLTEVPIIGAGGIHSPQDARDYMDAGARAVQVDSATWVQPRLIELIARDLGGLVLTQPSGALPDEWHPGMGETDKKRREQGRPFTEGDTTPDTTTDV